MSEGNTTRYQFVEPEEFVRLALSRAVLVRSDDPVHRVRGLYDPVTGVTFVVEQDRVRRGS
jgi:hypothetical protein